MDRLEESMATLTANHIFLQTLLQNMLATQERVIGKLSLMEAHPKLVYTSPVKRLLKPNQLFKPSQSLSSVEKGNSSATEKEANFELTLQSTPSLATEIIFDDDDVQPLVPKIENEEAGHQLSYGVLQRLAQKASSVPNFAKLLAEQLFTVDELKSSNVSGSKGKQKLDKQRMEKIKLYVFQVYTMSKSQEEIAWKKCRDAINEYCRRK